MNYSTNNQRPQLSREASMLRIRSLIGALGPRNDFTTVESYDPGSLTLDELNDGRSASRRWTKQNLENWRFGADYRYAKHFPMQMGGNANQLINRGWANYDPYQDMYFGPNDPINLLDARVKDERRNMQDYVNNPPPHPLVGREFTDEELADPDYTYNESINGGPYIARKPNSKVSPVMKEVLDDIRYRRAARQALYNKLWG